MIAPRQYELVYITTPDASEQQLADLHAQVESIVSRFGGRVDNTENWGRRKLAYEIGRQKEGVYVLEVLDPPPPPPEPARIKHGEGGKGGGVHGDSDHDAPAGVGDPNSAAN